MDPITLTTIISGAMNVLGGLLGKKKSSNRGQSQGDSFVSNMLGLGKDVVGAFGAAASRKEARDMYNEQNSHMTGRELEAARFNAEQAQLNRDFQQEMSDTSYQRTVSDMQRAGVNPALAMSNGGASTPSGSNATAPGIGYEGIGELISVLTQAKVAEAQIGLMRSEEAENYSNIDVNERRVGEIVSNIEMKKREIAKTDIELNYFDDLMRSARDQASWDVRNAEQDYKNKEQLWKQYDETVKKILKEREEIDAKIALLSAQKEFTDKEKEQLSSLIAQSNAMTAKLYKESNLLNRDAEDYQFNHAKELRVDESMKAWVVGVSVGETVLVLSDGRIYSPRLGRFLDRTKGSSVNKKKEKTNSSGVYQGLSDNTD